MTIVPMKEDVVSYMQQKQSTQDQFDKAIQHTNDLSYAMDLAGLEFTPAAYGTKIQSWLETKYGWSSIPQHLNEGDFNCQSMDMVELKVSIIKKGSKANLLNLRLDSPVSNYMFIIRNTLKQYTKMFLIPKKEVQYMVDTYKEGRYNKHHNKHADIRLDVDCIVWDDDPDLNLWSCMHKFEICEQTLKGL